MNRRWIIAIVTSWACISAVAIYWHIESRGYFVTPDYSIDVSNMTRSQLVHAWGRPSDTLRMEDTGQFMYISDGRAAEWKFVYAQCGKVVYLSQFGKVMWVEEITQFDA